MFRLHNYYYLLFRSIAWFYIFSLSLYSKFSAIGTSVDTDIYDDDDDILHDFVYSLKCSLLFIRLDRI